MNDTVTKILDLVGEYAEHYAEDRKWGTFNFERPKWKLNKSPQNIVTTWVAIYQ